MGCRIDLAKKYMEEKEAEKEENKGWDGMDEMLIDEDIDDKD